MKAALDIAVSPFRLSSRVFAVFALIYLCTWAGHYTSGDGNHKIAWAKAMLGHTEGLKLDQNGVYSKYGIGHSLLAIPPLEAAYWIQKKTGIRSEAALYTLMFVVNGALFLALVAYYLSHFYPVGAVWGTVLTLGLATTWWPYTKLDFTEPLVLTAAFLGFLLIRFGKPVPGLLIAGFTLTLRPDAVVIVGPIAAWYLLGNRSIRALVQIVLSFAPSIALVLFSNYLRYHSWTDQGYADQRFSNPLLVGLYGILLSSGKSIFLFSPPLLLGVWGWKQFARRKEITSDAWLFLAICSAQVLFYAKYWIWSSDDAWGMRYVLPGVLLLCIPMVTVLHRRRIVVPVVAAGVLVQLLAVTVGGLDFLMLLRTSHPQREALWVGGANRIDFDDVWFDPNYSQIAGNWILLRCLLHLPPEPRRAEDTATVGTSLYDAIPPQAWQATARWDFIWNLRRPAGPVRPSDAPALTTPATSGPVE
jgi:hypothetical protein